MSQVIKLRNGTSAQWAASTRILQRGEFGVDITLNKFKVGNGTSQWSVLPFLNVLPAELEELSEDIINAAISAGTGIAKSYNDETNTILISVDTDTIATRIYVDQAITGVNNQSGTTYVLVSDVGNPDGVASLDSTGYIPDSEIPASIVRDSELSSHTGATTSVHGITDTSALATKTYADNAASTAVSAILDSAPGTLNTLNELAAAINDDASFASTVTTALGLKAPLESPTFTGTVILPTETIRSSDLHWEHYNSEAELPSAATKHGMFAHVHGTGSAYFAHSGAWYKLAKQTEVDLKSPIESPTFTGTVSGITKSMVGLSDVDNVSTTTIYSNQYVTVAGTSRTISSTTDKFNVLEFTSGLPITVTIPSDSQDSGWPIGSSVEIRQAGSGQITITKDGAVTYNAPDSQYKTRVQWSSLFLEKRAANTWLVTGDATA